ncbi:Hypothetical predicted protein [Paramuricea clavata]|uniref:Uncharacterized protein n=1 Tax=Paramuricea clavata TaxID=317549 RepID=A0A6S7H2R2_PARCT|nr:Hypothetical predicted protein [Paramuricea clavata]
MSEDKDEITRLNPVARAILQGLYDTESPLHKLLGLHYVLKAIWNNVVDHWKSRIKKEEEADTSYVSFVKLRTQAVFPKDVVVVFPKPCKININMMPFVMGRDFRETRLPKYLLHYWDQIIKHCIMDSEVGKIGYLTIHESYVDEGTSQRRPGIHTESPGVVMLKDSKGCVMKKYFGWGGRYIKKTELEGGIFMASNVENSCRVWNCEILRPEVDSLDVVGKHGDIEHLREFLPADSETMTAGRVYWITDRTPHESLPLKKGIYRQFFRLVTSLVTAWFEDHSTKNPNGVVPDPKLTKIVKGSKFDGICCVIEP